MGFWRCHCPLGRRHSHSSFSHSPRASEFPGRRMGAGSPIPGHRWAASEHKEWHHHHFRSAHACGGCGERAACRVVAPPTPGSFSLGPWEGGQAVSGTGLGRSFSLAGVGAQVRQPEGTELWRPLLHLTLESWPFWFPSSDDSSCPSPRCGGGGQMTRFDSNMAQSLACGSL